MTWAETTWTGFTRFNMSPNSSNVIDPVALMQFMLIVQFLMGMVLGVLQFLNQRRAQRRDVSMIEEFATRRELAQLAEKVDSRFEDLRCEIRDDKTELLRAGEERAVKLHERCNAILQAVSEVRGEMHSRRSQGGREEY